MSSSSATVYELSTIEIRRTLRWRVVRGWQLMSASKIATASAAVLLIIVLAAIFAPVIAPYDPTGITADTLQGPSLRHLFGTDQFGRDMFSRILWGARLTLPAAVLGVLISTAFGVPLGLIAGYAREWVSFLIMRAMDVLLAFPGLLLALVIVTIIGSGETSVVVAIGVSFIPVFARLIYGSTLSAKEFDYVMAAQALGCGAGKILRSHVLPGVVAQIIVLGSSAIGWAILTAATLNFLGFGVHLPTAEWGADLSQGREWINVAWWIAAFPGLAITITILTSNYLGDHLAALLDARTRSGMEASLTTIE
jgi:peptide/nickel transport system permease protein